MGAIWYLDVQSVLGQHSSTLGLDSFGVLFAYQEREAFSVLPLVEKMPRSFGSFVMILVELASGRVTCPTLGSGAPRRWPNSVLRRAHFYAWVSARDAPLLSHFLRWYSALGLELTVAGRARIILHDNGSEPMFAVEQNASTAVLRAVLGATAFDANVVLSTESFSALAKTKRVNACMSVCWAVRAPPTLLS